MIVYLYAMNKFQTNTEVKILKTAKEIFVRKGFDAVRMKEIAVIAQVNNASLYYYFRNKKRLFEVIFKDVFIKFLDKITSLSEENIPVSQRIKELVNTYIDLLTEEPLVANFILHELRRNPERILEILKYVEYQSYELKLSILTQQIQNPKSFVLDFISLCTFPYICIPAFSMICFGNDTAGYQKFLSSRKDEISTLLIRSLVNNQN